MKRSAEEERQQDETKRQKLDEEKERKLLDTPEVKKAIGQLGNTSEVTKVILNLLKNPPSIKDSKTNLTSIKDVGDLGAAGFKWAGALKLKETQTSDWSTKCGISHWSQENLIKDLEELKNTFSVRLEAGCRIFIDALLRRLASIVYSSRRYLLVGVELMVETGERSGDSQFSGYIDYGVTCINGNPSSRNVIVRQLYNLQVIKALPGSVLAFIPADGKRAETLQDGMAQNVAECVAAAQNLGCDTMRGFVTDGKDMIFTYVDVNACTYSFSGNINIKENLDAILNVLAEWATNPPSFIEHDKFLDFAPI